jgi:hypothetical protein
MKRKSKQKRFSEMTLRELTEATKVFDQEFIAETFRPLNEEQRARWERAKQKGGHSNGSSVKAIVVHVNKSLLDRSEGLAKRKGLTRDALIDQALKSVLAAEN